MRVRYRAFVSECRDHTLKVILTGWRIGSETKLELTIQGSNRVAVAADAARMTGPFRHRGQPMPDRGLGLQIDCSAVPSRRSTRMSGGDTGHLL